MNEKKIRKKLYETRVSGFTIQDGNPVESEYVLNGKISLERAQRMIRAYDPSFSASSVKSDVALYEISYDDFMKNSKKINVNMEEI